MKPIRSLAFLTFFLWPLLSARVAKPNIIVILADDLGWGSAGCYGADPALLRTPGMDRLAREGRRFTEAYVTASICTPSRYAFLTGRYCWRGPLKYEVIKTHDPLLIEKHRPTVASMLKQQGYRTAVIGKWHLGFGTSSPVDYTAALKPGPLEIGFEYFHGLASNHGDGTGVYLDTVTDASSESLVKVAGLRSAKTEPFGKTTYGGQFMGLDAPQRVDEEVMPHLTQKAVAWIDGQRASGKPFFLYFSPVSAHSPSTPSDQTKGTSKAGVYGDWIHELDLSIGQLLDALDRMKIADNTLVLLTSDNGGEDRNFAHAELKAIASGLKMNGHLRAGKHSIFEGGMRVPFIARWPKKIAAGSVSNVPVSLVDLFASFATLTGAELPPVDVGAEDSFNVLPAFFEDSAAPLRPAIVGHSGWGVFSIRKGPWKWIEGKHSTKNRPKGDGDQLVPQLYNLEKDPSETRNVLSEYPEIAAELSELLETWRKQGHSRP
jgi:arylsulfatase A-like enzyme